MSFVNAPPVDTRIKSLSVDSGSFLLSGQNINFKTNLPLQSGSFSLTGQNVTLSHSYNIAAGIGSFALTGQDAHIYKSRLAMGIGSFALTGQNVTLTHDQGGYINSIQQFSITIASGSTSNTATISAVSSGAFIIFQGTQTSQTSNSNSNSFRGRLTLTNSTTVTATRGASNSDTLTIKGVVIDAKTSLVSSVQFGTASIAASTSLSTTATISSVNTSRSVVFYLGSSLTNSSISPRDSEWGVTLTNSTTVTAKRENNTSTTQTISFVVVEFASSVIQSVQQFSTPSTSSNSTDAQTISSVNTSNSFIAYGGLSSTNNFFSNYASYLSLTSSTNVNVVRVGTSTASRTAYYAVVEFVSGVLSANQKGTITMSSVTSNTATISSADTAKSVLNFTGNDSNISTNLDSFFSNAVQTNSTTITANRNTGSGNSIVGYEAITFNQ